MTSFAHRLANHILASFPMLLFLLAISSAVVAPGRLAADDGASRSDAGASLSNVSVGIQGNYQVGCWTAIEADIRSDSWPVTLSVRVPDPDGNLTRQPSIEIARPDAQAAHVRSLFKTGRLSDAEDSQKSKGFGGQLQVDLETPRGTKSFFLISGEPVTPRQIQVSTLKNAWTQKTELWAALGDAEGFEQAARQVNARDGGLRRPVHLVNLSDASELPVGEEALESLSLLVVTGAQQIAPETNDAIRRWVAGGGHLILSVATPEEYASLPLSEWIPVRVNGKSRLRDLSNLTTRLPGSVPIRVELVDALQFDFDHGETMAATLDGPLWARVPHVFGHVTVLGVDLSRRPLVSWESLPQLCESLAGFRRVVERKRPRSATAQLSQTGVSDLQTQLMTGLDQFPESQKPTSWYVMGMILLYMLAIGPLDYFVVHKLLKRPQLTWVTFPLMVMVATAAAAATARERNPQHTLANQVDVMDLDVQSSLLRRNSWVSFTSPESTRYRVEAESTNVPEGKDDGHLLPPRVCWAGTPESGFRGMYRTGGLDQWKASYSLAPDQSGILDLPVMLWSSANVAAQGRMRPAVLDQIVEANLVASTGQLRGTLTNRLSVPMSDWFVAHQGRAYVPQTRTVGAAALRIAPGETLEFADHRRVVPRVLQSYLTGVRRLQVEQGSDRPGQSVVAVRDTYDPLVRDPYDVWRMVTFYEAARGEEFTTLQNQVFRDLDLSPLLHLDRAILFCQIETPAVEFSTNGNPLKPTEHHTILRIVLPVQAE